MHVMIGKELFFFMIESSGLEKGAHSIRLGRFSLRFQNQHSKESEFLAGLESLRLFQSYLAEKFRNK
jgi:hypothetical protein